jgi:hypothetical protein
MKPWRSTSSPPEGTEKRSEVGAIIKFRANLVDSLGEMLASPGLFAVSR